MQQAALAIHQCAQAGAHAVEVAAQIDQLVAAHGAGAEAWRKVAGGGGFERVAQGADGARKIPGQQRCEQQAGEDGGADHHALADPAPRAGPGVDRRRQVVGTALVLRAILAAGLAPEIARHERDVLLATRSDQVPRTTPAVVFTGPVAITQFALDFAQ